MAENSSLSQNNPKSVGSIFSGFLTRASSDAETMSPVSVLDTKLPSSRSSPSTGKSVQSFSLSHKLSSGEEIGSMRRGIGLVLDEKTETSSGEFNTNGKILFGSNLKIQIPNLFPSSPPPAADFGIKTRESSSSSSSYSQMIMSPLWINSPRTMSSLREMELSEDYTCVISHGPNPRTTHIFDNCIVHDNNLVVSLSQPNTG